MARSGVFYAVRAMERAAAGVGGESGPGGSARRAVARPAAAAGRPAGSIFSLVRRALAAVRRGMGGVRGRGGRGLGGAAQAD